MAGLNLRAATAGVVAAVNPQILVSISKSTGYTTASDGTQIPTYAEYTGVLAQMQALSSDDLRQLEGMNLQGNRQAMYLFGQWAALVRADSVGGDIITLADGTKWLTAVVLENWPNWTKFALVQQL